MSKFTQIFRDIFELDLKPWQEGPVIGALAAMYEPPNRYERLHSVILRRVEHLLELADTMGLSDAIELREREVESWGRRDYLRDKNVKLYLVYEKNTDNCILTDEDLYAISAAT